MWDIRTAIRATDRLIRLRMFWGGKV